MPDAINPAHYTQGKVECIDAIESALGHEGFIAFLRGQVIKYNWRMGLKDAPLQEAKKSKWYQDRLIATLEAGILSSAQTDQKVEAENELTIKRTPFPTLDTSYDQHSQPFATCNCPGCYPLRKRFGFGLD